MQSLWRTLVSYHIRPSIEDKESEHTQIGWTGSILTIIVNNCWSLQVASIITSSSVYTPEVIHVQAVLTNQAP